MKSTAPRLRAEKLAALMLAGHPRTVTDGATYFHTRVGPAGLGAADDAHHSHRPPLFLPPGYPRREQLTPAQSAKSCTR